MKSLQNKYNLIKEGKGNKELFLKEAKTLFPNVVTNVLTYDQAIHNLKERGIISEGFIGISDQKTVEPNWFKIFKENVVDLKEGDINQAVAFYNKNQHLGTKAVAEKFGVEEADLMKALGQTPGGLFETGLKEGIDVEDLKPGEVYDYRGTITRGPNEGKPITGKLKFNKVDERNPNMFIFTWVEIESPDYDTRVGHSFYTSKQGLSKYLYKKDSITETVDVKASLKQTDKSVEDKETTGYDYKEKKNNNNISTAEILKGYYAEMKDPKNADKTEEELKKIVFKNLEKDPMYYVKSGEFGLKDVGYTEDAPGLGATKEVKGKYKSSGMEPVKLNEVVTGENPYFDTDPSDGDADFDMREMVRAEELYEKGLQAYSEGDLLKAQQYYKDALKAGSWLGWTEFDLPPYGNGINESLDETDITGIAGSEDEEDYKKGTKGVKKQKIKEYGEATGEVTFEYTFDEVEYEGEIYNIEATITAEIEDDDVSSSHPDDPTPTVQKTVAWKVDSLDSVKRYNAATQEYIPATLSFDDKERLKKLVETSIEYKDMVVDKALDTYYNYEGLSEEVEEKAPKKQLMPNKQKGIADAIEVKSTLEKIAGEVWKESDLKKAKEIVKQYLEDSKVNPASKKKMLDNTELIQSKTKLDVYIANALLKYENLSVNEGILAEVLNNNIPDFLKDMIEDAIEDSKNGYVVHIEYAGAGRYRTSDWFDSDNTVYSVEDGRVLLDKTKEIDAEGNWEGATLDEKQKNMTTLSEAKKRAIEKHLKEIEKLSEIAAMDHKIQKIQEKIEELKNKLTMTEGDDFVGMVDKNAVKEIKKDIAFLEKRKKIAEAQKGKLAKRVSGESKPQTGTGGTTTTGMMETQPANLREMIKNVISSRKQKK